MAKPPNHQKRLRSTKHPVLYEVNTRVLLGELSRATGTRVTLDTIPEHIIEDWAELGLDAIWLMGVWKTGELGVQIAREHRGLREEYKRALPDFADNDVVGSPYSIMSYSVAENLGGNKGLSVLRRRLEKKGLGLILDFVCNHTSRDARWLIEHPEYYIGGRNGDDVARPDRFFKTATSKGERIIAYGRDPYFAGWTDTAQLNPRHPGTRQAMLSALKDIAGMCDGVRCDMAMLVLHQVFADTWGDYSMPHDAVPVATDFWRDAIPFVKKEYPDFLFIAEAYWDLEWRLQQEGFDYAYDKTLYDRLLREGASAVYGHLRADMNYQEHLVRFIENHDEPRATHALAGDAWHFGAAVAALSIPGMVLLHEGQLDGRKVKLPVQLGRRPYEPPSTQVLLFYKQLLSCITSPAVRQGNWRLLTCRPAWHDNQTWRNFLAFWWHSKQHGSRLVVVNYAPLNSQGYVELSLDGFDTPLLELRDLLGPSVYLREKSAITSKGLYFDLPAYGFHFFEVLPAKR